MRHPGFPVLRRNARGSFVVATTAATDATSRTTASLAPDTSHAYRVRTVNGAGASGYAETEGATDPTLAVDTLKADLKDSPSFG
jgi:hypothetical protein